MATYGRSLYALVTGLLCGRWTYRALGAVDYGLMGLVAALTVIITYLNDVLSSAIARYYAISIGEEKRDYEHGLETSRKWFTTAFVIQSVLPTILLICGYPLGVYAINHFLEIPVERLESCIWIWRFVCASCYLSMLSVPWRSMYFAHQYIAELTIYSVATTTFNAMFLYYMVTHPGTWLVKFSFWQCCLNILPTMIIAVRAHFLFPECRLKYKYFKCGDSIKKMFSYAGWNAVGLLGYVTRTQGITVLVNKSFGPVANAGLAIGNTVAGHCNTLSSSLNGAFSPAIFNAWGAGEYDNARNMAFRVCKFGSLLVLIFAMPLALEINKILQIWLKEPPIITYGLCVLALAVSIIEKLSTGCAICIQAKGRVATYQILEAMSYFITLPVAFFLIKIGLGVYSVGWALIVSATTSALVRILMARVLVDLSFSKWLRHVVMPVAGVLVCALLAGSIPKMFMDASFVRILITIACVEIPTLFTCWYIVLDSGDRDLLRGKIKLLKTLRI